MSEMGTRGEGSSIDEEEISIEAPEADAVEQHTDVRPRSGPPRPELSPEVDPGDAIEQALDERQSGDYLRRELPFDVDPADAAEQDRVVELDDDDYR